MVNVTKINKLFPTVVHEFQYIADDNLTKAIKNEDLETKIINHTSSSVDNNLQKRKEYKPLVDKILSTTKEICELHEYEYKSIEITNLWVNASPPKSMHSPHTHSNNNFSGTWYPIECKETPIIFIDPRAQNAQWSPKKRKTNDYTGTLVSFSNKKNLGLILPSWLMHYVPPAVGNRVSVSWNVLIRGDYGEPNTLQNASI